MASRHEEKYIIDYRQYLTVKKRVMGALTPDRNSSNGSYIINSLYFDDRMDTALYEKLDGLPEHSKFRVRTYGFSDKLIKLERKDKHGILTEKCDCVVTKDQIALLGREILYRQGELMELTAQMKAAGLVPTVAVRYQRDAYFHEGSDLRITFDRNIEAIRPEECALFDPGFTGIPILDRNSVIMEIKYGNFIPGFARKLTNIGGKQLSVSKYALCREIYHF